MVNVMLNYGYALFEAECLRAINTVGLDENVGFLHEMNPVRTALLMIYKSLSGSLLIWQLSIL
jgi:CRISPR/Cas system-associated endonuclease Cas1